MMAGSMGALVVCALFLCARAQETIELLALHSQLSMGKNFKQVVRHGDEAFQLMEAAHIWPDVTDPFNVTVKMEIKYGPSVEVNDDVALTTQATVAEPSVEFSSPGYYTLFLVDADSTAKPSYLHWMVSDIPAGNMEEAKTVVEYFSPHGAEPHEVSHRYVFLLYKHSGANAAQGLSPPGGREGFDARKYASEHGLGSPVGCLFFYSRVHDNNAHHLKMKDPNAKPSPPAPSTPPFDQGTIERIDR